MTTLGNWEKVCGVDCAINSWFHWLIKDVEKQTLEICSSRVEIFQISHLCDHGITCEQCSFFNQWKVHLHGIRKLVQPRTQIVYYASLFKPDASLSPHRKRFLLIGRNNVPLDLSEQVLVLVTAEEKRNTEKNIWISCSHAIENRLALRNTGLFTSWDTPWW